MPEKPLRRADTRWTLAEMAYRDGDSVSRIAARLSVTEDTVRDHIARDHWQRAGEAAARVVARLARTFDPQMREAEAALAAGDPTAAERRAKALSALARAAGAFTLVDRAPGAPSPARAVEPPEETDDDDRAYVLDHAERLARQERAHERDRGADA